MVQICPNPWFADRGNGFLSRHAPPIHAGDHFVVLESAGILGHLVVKTRVMDVRVSGAGCR